MELWIGRETVLLTYSQSISCDWRSVHGAVHGMGESQILGHIFLCKLFSELQMQDLDSRPSRQRFSVQTTLRLAPPINGTSVQAIIHLSRQGQAEELKSQCSCPMIQGFKTANSCLSATFGSWNMFFSTANHRFPRIL
eukprot:s1105_g2.t1